MKSIWECRDNKCTFWVGSFHEDLPGRLSCLEEAHNILNNNMHPIYKLDGKSDIISQLFLPVWCKDPNIFKSLFWIWPWWRSNSSLMTDLKIWPVASQEEFPLHFWYSVPCLGILSNLKVPKVKNLRQVQCCYNKQFLSFCGMILDCVSPWGLWDDRKRLRDPCWTDLEIASACLLIPSRYIAI